ncbi:hypothetical protein [Paenibacillus albidus]|uniref:hypothetical protein n=1 Tax=Paenibacillus albidus TaxID=2041023 RepID=UPI001BEBA8EE|nr:hypothetical protein [Paenibacillus albidus]
MENQFTVTEACQKFLEDQEKLRMCAKQSLLPTLEINTDEADWDSYAKQILGIKLTGYVSPETLEQFAATAPALLSLSYTKCRIIQQTSRIYPKRIFGGGKVWSLDFKQTA